MGFDKVITANFDSKELMYGITFGTGNKILIIKPGAGGSIYGYENKYLYLALRLQKEHGFSTLCCSDVKGTSTQKEFDFSILQNEFGNLDGKEILCLGFSRGASQLAIYWSNDTRVNKLLLVNPPLMINTPHIIHTAKTFSGEMMKFLFGSEDPSMNLVPLLKLHERENLKVEVIEGEDHLFSKNWEKIYEEVLD